MTWNHFKGGFIHFVLNLTVFVVVLRISSGGWRVFVREAFGKVQDTPLPLFSWIFGQWFPEMAKLEVSHLIAGVVFFLTLYSVREAVFYTFFSRKRATAYQWFMILLSSLMVAGDMLLFIYSNQKASVFKTKGQITTPVLLGGFIYCVVLILLGCFAAKTKRETDEEHDPVGDDERRADGHRLRASSANGQAQDSARVSA